MLTWGDESREIEVMGAVVHDNQSGVWLWTGEPRWTRAMRQKYVNSSVMVLKTPMNRERKGKIYFTSVN